MGDAHRLICTPERALAVAPALALTCLLQPIEEPQQSHAPPLILSFDDVRSHTCFRRHYSPLSSRTQESCPLGHSCVTRHDRSPWAALTIVLLCWLSALQRGWTVQEFCSCSKAYVVTETIGRGSTISTRKSRLRLAVVHASPDVTTAGQDEEEYFWSLRAWHHERVVHCTPFWLYGSDGLLEDDIEAAVLKYAELQRLVTTGKAKDMVRALVPMLANCPVETQDELVALLRLMDARVNSSDIQAMLAICMQKSRFASQSGSTGTAVIAASIPATTFSFFYETPSLEDIDPSGHQQQAANCSPLVTTTSLIQVEPHTPGADREDDIEANMLLAGCTALAPNANRVTFLRQ